MKPLFPLLLLLLATMRNEALPALAVAASPRKHSWVRRGAVLLLLLFIAWPRGVIKARGVLTGQTVGPPRPCPVFRLSRLQPILALCDRARCRHVAPEASSTSAPAASSSKLQT